MIFSIGSEILSVWGKMKVVDTVKNFRTSEIWSTR